jgi:hypothetical protein
MTRRSLLEGLKETPTIDPQIEQQFVKGSEATPNPTVKVSNSASVARTPVSTRLRTDLAEALQRASLTRKLEKVEPNSLTEILEAAVEPWLRDHGYLH